MSQIIFNNLRLISDQWPTTVVISAVNLVEGGALQVLRQCIRELILRKPEKCRIYILVNNKSLFDFQDVDYIEYPDSKKSWFNRIKFEYWTCRQISKDLKPDFWLSMHDATPSLDWPSIQAVYCHNPMPFYKISLKEAWWDPKIFIFAFLYQFVYRINLKNNSYVIVQQQWLREIFQKKFNCENVIVAYPQLSLANEVAHKRQGRRFFYPALPRVFKNFEILLSAWELLEQDSTWDGYLTVTIDGTENRYSKSLIKRYKNLRTVNFCGRLSHEQVMLEYKHSDALLFPSKAETWGLPITEAKNAGLSIFLADLPYAKEAVGAYDGVVYFNPFSAEDLANKIRKFSIGQLDLEKTHAVDVPSPMAVGWSDLWKLLLTNKTTISF